MGVSSPTGNGEKRGMEWAGQPGTPAYTSRPEFAKANSASAKFTGIRGHQNDRAADGSTDMKASPIR